jgi:hypothetical protein
MAASALDLLTKPELLKEAWEDDGENVQEPIAPRREAPVRDVG